MVESGAAWKVPLAVVGALAFAIVFVKLMDGGDDEPAAAPVEARPRTPAPVRAKPKPPPPLPDEAIPASGVLGKRRKAVRRLFREDPRPKEKDRGAVYEAWDLDGATLTVGYVKGRAVEYRLEVPQLEARGSEVLAWAGVVDGRQQLGKLEVNATMIPIADDLVIQTKQEEARQEYWSRGERRKMAAEFMERNIRAGGFAASVTARGKNNSTIRIRWDGCDDVQLDVLTDMPEFAELQYKYEIRRVECDNGYRRYSVTYRDVKP